ncbi:hypothetical protein ACL03H_00860 [Saccharopolyspora sp. MS10]|uniref:hypothetical protein n=1 Tax=Saccharopolyspora sp. MS10 TaxID=3385973 RepID=UPI0039A1A0B0
METASDESVRAGRARSGAADLDAGEFLALLEDQADAVAMVWAKWAEAVRSVPSPPEFDRVTSECRVAPLEIARRDLWFRAESIREAWFSHYALWVGWWVDTAQLALEAAAGRRVVELGRVIALRPPQACLRIEDEASPLEVPLRYWDERAALGSLPDLLGTEELGELLALVGNDRPAEKVEAACQALRFAGNAGDLALEQEETGSADQSVIDRNWNLYGFRYQLACEFAQAVLDHLR